MPLFKRGTYVFIGNLSTKTLKSAKCLLYYVKRKTGDGKAIAPDFQE